MPPSQPSDVALFESSLRLLGQSNSELDAVITLQADRLKMKSGEHEIGDWYLDELIISRRRDGFLLQVESEELVVTVTDPDAFAAAVGMGEPVDDQSVRRVRVPRASQMGGLLTRFKNLPDRRKAALGVALGLVVFGVLAPGLLAALLIFAGMITLVIAGLAFLDDPSMYSIVPDIVSEATLIISGFAMTAVGIVLMMLT